MPAERAINGASTNGHHSATNGGTPETGRFIDRIDPEDPDYIREMQRPADVSEDMHEMKRRERVTMVLKSQAFRDELESIIQDALKEGRNPTSLLALQQISELVLPQNRFNQQNLAGSGPAMVGKTGAIIPVADIRGVDTLHYTKGEKLLRCKLASLYRLVDLMGWTHGIYNHITVRINQEDDHFLINPFGMLYHEVTASSLVKVDLSGQVVDAGSTTLGINLAGYLLHSAIHGARPDIRCVIHFHTGACVAVSSYKDGLLPISQEAAILGGISYHDYNGILIDETERDKIIRNLGPFNKVMILRNHGAVACGATIEEAFHFAFNLVAACETQVKAMAGGVEKLILMSEETQKKVYEVATKSGGGGGVDSAAKKGEDEKSGRKWKVGELEFEAWMRMLDNMGYRTGYIYRHPVIRNDQPNKSKSNQDVEIPPASTSIGYDDDGIGSLLKEYLERKKGAEKIRWLNTPNSYQKVELLEAGTKEPKRITKWVQDSAASPGGTPVKVSTLQFSPAGTNVKEFKQKQREMKEKRSQGIISSGPDSKVLEGVTWEEADHIPDAVASGAGDKLITVGAVSKGIIRRDQQHNVGAYQTTYQRNPFDSNAPEDVERYMLEVESKARHGTPGSAGEFHYEVRMEQKEQERTPAAARLSKTPPPTPANQEGSFSRSKSDRFAKGELQSETETGSEPSSPALDRGMRKSDTLDSSELGSDKKKSKKKGFRMPSFSLGRKKSKDGVSEGSEL